MCRPVVQPTCENKLCSAGQICSEAPDAHCAAPPCRAKLVCSAASAWYQVAGGLTGPGGAAAAGQAGDFGGLGSDSSRSEQLRLRPATSRGSGKDEDEDEDDD